MLFAAGLALAAGAGLAAQEGPAASQDDQVRALLQMAPAAPAERPPGLREFSRSRFDGGRLTATVVGMSAAIFMQAPGLALFYCGLVNYTGRAELMARYLFIGVVASLAWVLWTYSLAFSRNEYSFDATGAEIMTEEEQFKQGNRYIGGTKHFGMQGFESRIEDEAPAFPVRRPSDHVPHLAFMSFQMALFLAAVAPLVLGFLKSFDLGPTALFILAWGTLIYAPIAYWTAGGGWHAATLDYAGGLTTHVCIAGSAIAARVALTRNRAAAAPSGGERPLFEPRLGPLLLGAALFWTGSLLVSISHGAADARSVSAAVTTHLAACTGVIGWTGAEWLSRGRFSLWGIGAGAMAGLFTVAAPCGFVAPQSALIIGAVAGSLSYAGFQAINSRSPGDLLLSISALQGIAGGLGVLAAGVFATSSVAGSNAKGTEIRGLLVGDPQQLIAQAAALGATVALAFAGTLLLTGMVRLVWRPRAGI